MVFRKFAIEIEKLMHSQFPTDTAEGTKWCDPGNIFSSNLCSHVHQEVFWGPEFLHSIPLCEPTYIK